MGIVNFPYPMDRGPSNQYSSKSKEVGKTDFLSKNLSLCLSSCLRASSTSHNAVESVKTLVTRMINQSAIVSQMKNSIAKMNNIHGINLTGSVGGELMNEIISQIQ